MNQMILNIFIGIPLFIISGAIHEFFHGYSAYLLGDDTAKRSGRLSINPMAHVSLIGTILLPAFALISSLPVIGWMKPVPINPYNFKNISRDQAITAFAGPFANLFQTSFSFLIIKFILVLQNSLIPINAVSTLIVDYAIMVFQIYAQINLFFLFFNLLPIPPLDGSWILRYFLPENLKRYFDVLFQYSFIVLLIFIATGLLNKVLLPAIYLFKILISFLYTPDYTIFYFLGIFLFFPASIYFFYQRNKSNLNNIRSFNFNEEQKIEVATKYETIKKDNTLYHRILNNVLDNKPLTDEETAEVIKNSSYDNLCSENDFKSEDEYCLTCDTYKNCVSRKINSYKKSE